MHTFNGKSLQRLIQIDVKLLKKNHVKIIFKLRVEIRQRNFFSCMYFYFRMNCDRKNHTKWTIFQ